MLQKFDFEVPTQGRGTYDLTGQIDRFLETSGVSDGLCHIFLRHTSASLIVCENADPAVKTDLEAFIARLVPDGDKIFSHTAEGPDDMPAHVRSVLTHTELSVPIRERRLDLGTWQGIYLWEHRASAHRRKITLTVLSG